MDIVEENEFADYIKANSSHKKVEMQIFKK